MITYGEVEKFRSSRATDQSVLSLYVYMPPDARAACEAVARSHTRHFRVRAAGPDRAAGLAAPDVP
jgi:hypothetical protein